MVLEQWQEELNRRAQEDPWCRECTAEVQKWEEAYRKLYDSLEVGDLVRVEVGEGFFGIEYANVYSEE